MRINPFSFEAGKLIDRYEIIQPPGKMLDANGFVSPLSDKGATSIVYLAKQALGDAASIPRIIKLFAPTASIREKNRAAGKSYGETNFLEEMKLLSELTHQNLVKIIDAGKVDDANYYIMEFIDGATLEDLLDPKSSVFAAMQSRALDDPFVVIRLARQLCYALMYMHANRYYHFDVAPKNIFVRDATSRPHVVLGDLGVARRVPREEHAQVANFIYVAGTSKYTPPELRPYLNNDIAERDLAKIADRWESFSVSCVMKDMIEGWQLTDIKKLKALQIVAEKISGSSTYTCAQIYEELGRLLPNNVLTAGVEELSSDAAGERRYVNIPLFRVPISKRIETIINHPEFTRLQLVPQMFLVRSAFPGGVHSMYEHAIGSFGLSQRILQKLLSLPTFKAAFFNEELEEALVTSLITRASSFTLDRIVMETNNISKEGLLRERLDHLWGHENEKTFGATISKQFPAVSLDNVIANLTAGRDQLKDYQKLIYGMVRSSIDIRVMDYLARDSYHTGIPVGTGVDVSNIINNMTWIENDWSLGIRRGGVFDLENLFCARYWMFSRVYWSSPIRSIAAMLRHVVYRLTVTGKMDSEHLVRKLAIVDEAGALRVLESEWNSAVGEPNPPILNLLSQGRPRAYRRLLELFDRNWEHMEAVRKHCVTSEFLEQLSIDFHTKTKVGQELQVSDVLFDVPLERAEKLGEDIQVEFDKGETVLAKKVSEIINILPKTFEHSAIRLRVYCSPDFDRERQKQIRDQAKEFLDDRFKNAVA